MESGKVQQYTFEVNTDTCIEYFILKKSIWLNQ